MPISPFNPFARAIWGPIVLWVLTAVASPGVWAQAVAPSALPSGGVVTSGQAQIQTQPSAVIIQQSTPKAIIEWNSFNVGESASVQFQQPGRDSVIFNRILDASPSQILGRIQANGQVFLSNPSGIVFGSTAQIDVGGLVVTVHDIRDRDFQEGRYNFSSDSASAVINQGSLQARLGGYVALLAPEVRNEGIVLAKEGTAALASGRHISLTLQGSQLVSVSIAEPVLNALIENKHLVRAEGGLVVLSARSANALLESVIAQSGDIQAPSLLNRSGRVILDSGEKGGVSVSGNIDASGNAPGVRGGRIVVTGEHVSITGSAKVTALGSSGGGDVLVGGGWQGKDPEIREASTTTIATGVTIDASATDTGDGGTVVAWSSLTHKGGITKVEGSLRAAAGRQGGNGGRIETSGANLSLDNIRIDASAPRGTAGQWLIDPYNVTITSTNSNTNESSGEWTAFDNDSRIWSEDIEEALDAGTNVLITTAGAGSQAGDIFVIAPIASSRALASLSLVADRNISIESVISLTGSGSLVKLQAGGAVTGTSAIRLNAQVTSDTVHLVATEGGAITQSAALRTNNLAIDAPESAVTLNHEDNEIGVISADVASISAISNTLLDLQHGYGPGLTIGQVAGLSGISASESIDISSRQSHIYILNDVETRNLTLNAGRDEDPFVGPSAGEKNIILKGTGPISCLGLQCPGIPTVTVTGLGKLYTGSLEQGSENIALLAGVGSGRFRYFSDEYQEAFDKPLGGTGLHVIYREQPTLTAYAGANTLEYGSEPEFTPRIEGLRNGDELDDAVPTLPSISIQATALSTSGQPIAGTHPTAVNSDQVGALGYGFTQVPGTVAITRKRLVIDGITGVDKVYDKSTRGEVDVSEAEFDGLVSQTLNGQTLRDVVSISAAGAFESMNVGEGIRVFLVYDDFGGVDRENYSIEAQSSTTADITRRPLTVSAATTMAKEYDGTNNAASVTSLSTNALSDDDVRPSAISYAFDSKNVTAQFVQVGGISIAGSSAMNYQLMNTATITTGTINPKALRVTGLTVPDRPYDGTTDIAPGTITGVTPGVSPLGNDSVGLSYGTQYSLAFTGKDVSSSANPIIFSGFDANNDPVTVGLTGADSANYTLERPSSGSPAALLAGSTTITPRPLEFSSQSTVAPSDYTGLRTVNVADISVGSLAQGGATGLVEASPGVYESLVVTANNGLFDSKAAGSRTATIEYRLADGNNGGLAINYSLASTTASATIRPINATISGMTAQSKTYDGTSSATVSTADVVITGLIANDDVSVSATGTFDDANAGTGKTVTLSNEISGEDKDNYTFTRQTTTTASIFRRGGLIALAPGVYLDTSLAAADGSSKHSIVYGTNLSNNYSLPTFAPAESATSVVESMTHTQVEISSPRSISLAQLSPSGPVAVPSGLSVSPSVLANSSINTPASVGIRLPPMMGVPSRGTALINRPSADGSSSGIAILTSARSSGPNNSPSVNTTSVSASDAASQVNNTQASIDSTSNTASQTNNAQDPIATLLSLDFQGLFMDVLATTQQVAVTTPVAGKSDAQLLTSLPLMTDQEREQLSSSQRANIEAMVELAMSDAIAPSNLSTTDIAELSVDTLKELSPATLVLFSDQQLRALSPSQVASLRPETRVIAEAWLKPPQSNMATQTRGTNLRPREGDIVRGVPLTKETLRLAYRIIFASEALSVIVSQYPFTGQIGPRQAASLPDQIVLSIKPQEWLRWPMRSFQSIQPRQIGLIDPMILEQLPIQKIQAMTKPQVAALSGEQVLVLLPKLAPSQRDALTASQREELRRNLLISMN